MNSGKIILSALAGVAIGATLGILFAPEKGSAIRKKISDKKDDFADDLEEKFNKFIDGITSKFETMKEDVTHTARSRKHNAETVPEDVTTDTK
ncbi:MAG: hypothetical protein FD166_3498 [Bacteroidetes bacterium]|nr:MAG: hypothetical protein FD166_3498 [Bacteroidota bacterium]